MQSLQGLSKEDLEAFRPPNLTRDTSNSGNTDTK